MARVIAFALALLLAACATPRRLVFSQGTYRLAHPLVDFYDSTFVWTDAGRGPPRVIDVQEMAARLRNYDVVIYGEFHGHAGVHLGEMRVLRALYARDPHLVLSLEQFERDTQDVLDAYLAERIGENTLIDRGRAWENYAAAYRPLVGFARTHHLPVVAAEAPTWEIACVGQWGLPILDKFSADERGWIARDVHVGAGAYRDKFQQFLGGSSVHGGDGDTSEGRIKAERSFAAQAARDDTMAESILAALRKYPGSQVLHLTGSFHAAGFLGTVERLRMRDPNLKIAVITPIEVADAAEPEFSAASSSEGTVLQLVYPTPDSFVADEDTSAWVQKMLARRKADQCKYSPD
jgi:uncharacterized iron-regulated protein